MIETTGIVAAIEGRSVLVQAEQQGCGRCHEEGGCGGTNLGNMLCSTPKAFRLQNPGNLRIGDRVTIAIPQGTLLRTVTRVYLIPLLALLVGAFVGFEASGEIGAIVGSVLGVAMAVVAMRLMRGTYPQPYIKQ